MDTLVGKPNWSIYLHQLMAGQPNPRTLPKNSRPYDQGL